jgi:hypothetical protein
MIGLLLGAACCSMLAMTSTLAQAESLPRANKVIALVPSAGCGWEQIGPRLEAAGQAMARDRRTSRVIIDRPADPGHNLDLMGRPSPLVAAMEVSGRPSDLGRFARSMARAFGRECLAGLYLVHERRLMITPRTWPLGEPSPQAKTLVTMNRKPGLSFDVFDREWSGPHAQLAMAWRAARGGNGHYVQNLVVGRIGRDTPRLDGIGEAEGPGVPSPQEREARVKTAAHARTFQDMGSSTMFVAREVILKD